MSNTYRKVKKTHLFLVITLLAVSSSQSLASDSSTSIYDEIWDNAVIFGDRENTSELSVKLRGRYHGQGFNVDGDGAQDSSWEHRRIRLGADVNINEKWTFGFDFNMKRDEQDDTIENFDFISVSYKWSENTEISFGKLRRGSLTREDSTSSNNILTLERSQLTSRFFVDNLGGVYVEHETGDWTIGGGILNGNTEEDMRLPTLQGAMLLQANAAKQINDNTEVRFDYLYNPGDPDNNDVQPYEHMMSLNSESQFGKFGFITDLIYAAALPEASGDLYGFVFMPHYMLTPKLQIVGRYTWSGSDTDNGIRLLNRYDRRAVPEGFERGDKHQAVYFGLNYYLYGHKLKLMSGVEYSDFDSVLGNTSVVTGSAALRFYF